MARIFNWAAQDCERLITVAGLRASKGRQAAFAQVTADTEAEARAAEAAGIEMVVCRARNVPEVRRGSAKVFVTAALGFAEAVTDQGILRTAFGALTAGADAVITARRLDIVELLAAEDIPVMGHLGFVPRKSTWVGGVRAVGKSAEEAEALFHRFRRLEDAGAFAVEAELVPSRLMSEISSRSGLVTVSLGSGRGAEVIFLFTSDICGEAACVPRHARAYGNLAKLAQKMEEERLAALEAFRADVGCGGFPADAECAAISQDALEDFLARIDP